MYRRLVPLWLLLFGALALAQAYRWIGGGAALARLAFLASVRLPEGLAESGGIGLAAAVLAADLLPLGIGVALARGAAFNPGRRPPAWEAVLRWLALGFLLVYATALMALKARSAAAASVLLSGQIGKPPWLVFTASQAPHMLVEALALGLIFTAPVFWAIRAVQVRSLSRPTFEAWAEVRQLALPAVLLLVAAAALEVYVAPTTTAWLFSR